MPIAHIRLAAFDKDSSGSHTRTIEATSLEDFKKQEAAFDAQVPFSRFYFDHEMLDGDEDLLDTIETSLD